MTKKLYVIDEDAGILDEVQGWFLAQADSEHWVYTSVLRQLVNRMYRDRDYQEKRTRQGRHTAYDYALDRDQKALAWAIRALVLHVPPQEKAEPEPQELLIEMPVPEEGPHGQAKKGKATYAPTHLTTSIFAPLPLQC